MCKEFPEQLDKVGAIQERGFSGLWVYVGRTGKRRRVTIVRLVAGRLVDLSENILSQLKLKVVGTRFSDLLCAMFAMVEGCLANR